MRRSKAVVQYLVNKHINIDMIRASVVEGYIKFLESNDYPNSAKNSYMFAFGAMTDNAIFLGWLTPRTMIDCSKRWYTKKSPKRAPDACVTDKLDAIFFNDYSIPVIYRCIYYLCRLIPNRISEILAMQISCIDYPEPGVFNIIIPTQKETPYHTPVFSKYPRAMTGTIEAILYNAIIQQRDFAMLHQNIAKEYARGYLFLQGSGTLVTNDDFNQVLCDTCKKYRLVDKKGNPAVVTSHDLRHVAIGERVRSNEISLEDTMLEANHSSILQTLDYTWQSLQDESEHLFNVSKEALTTLIPPEEDDPLQWAEDAANNVEPQLLNPKKYERLKSNPFVRLLPSYGICSNASCTPRFELCFDCPSFKADPKYLDYFISEVNYLEEKIKNLRVKNPQSSAVAFDEHQLEVLKKYINLVRKNNESKEINIFEVVETYVGSEVKIAS